MYMSKLLKNTKKIMPIFFKVFISVNKFTYTQDFE